MNTVKINEIVRRYHLSKSQQDSSLNYKQRLDILTEQLFREYLEVALDQAGCKASDILCIRHLHIPVRFSADKTDHEIFTLWLKQVVTSITRLFEYGLQKEWLVYPSQIQVHKSILEKLSLGDIGDVWAWQQMGILPSGDLSVTQIKQHWVGYLTAHPDIVPPILMSAKNKFSIHRLVRNSVLESADLEKLTVANIDALGLSVNWTKVIGQLQRDLTKFQSDLDSQFIQQIQQLDRNWQSLFKGSDFSTFIIQLREKTQLNKPIAAMLKHKLNVFLGLLLVTPNSGISSVSTDSTKLEHQLATWLSDTFKFVELNRENKQSEWYSDENISNDISRLSAEQNLVATETYAADKDSILTANFGGILFLFNLLKQEHWQAQLNELLDSQQSPQFILEHLAKTLLPEVDGDPALTVFTGEINQVSIDKHKGEALNEDTIIKISQLALALKLEIQKRLDCESDYAFHEMCRKTVKIEHDLGWVNVFYALDDANTLIRANGLDLDPGFIPWLGYTVTFYYE